MSSLEYDFLYKVMIFGDSGVGKSSLVLRFTRDDFIAKFQPTVGTEFAVKQLEIGSKIVKVQLWDTAGIERYRSVTTGYFNKAVGIILVFSITDRSSFKNVEHYLKYCRDRSGKDDIVMLLIGNKSDLSHERMVTTEEAKEFASINKLLFMETSALDSINVETAFFNISTAILSKSDPEYSTYLRPVTSKSYQFSDTGIDSMVKKPQPVDAA